MNEATIAKKVQEVEAVNACISAAGLQFEMFLANNVKFMYFDEIITFIHNVKSEKEKE